MQKHKLQPSVGNFTPWEKVLDCDFLHLFVLLACSGSRAVGVLSVACMAWLADGIATEGQQNSVAFLTA